ncbi:unnamed protein product [Rotaria magnacalcarata]|uniref:Uncharacterized protein n=1 Tax=Rotaria magnacalcarata TaxID=392030 RepID=A0A814QQ32_9BILA|nr:unnamed protein product [Rotaria magnacalcarata]CAF1685888.1 unnamed protein product [Rotaria magnacalcarata]CAF2136186.1 unnamed protein product [Rotaria magnacalcarata]CAF4013394.1 unnamed protein product [Rotaria magnacalcarata]CAF4209800.1 unnamed protein product [Rotaria magnacalcarata]
MWAIFYTIVLTVSITEAIPRTDVTVSGLSSGAAMTAQLHLAFSSTISGSGILAGPPYYCAEGSSTRVDTCLYGPTTLIPIEKLTSQLQSYVSAGVADPTSNLKNDPVYIFSGRFDPVVFPDVVKLNEKMFSSFDTNIKTNYEMRATHGFITDNFGGLCEFPDLKYFINNCSFNLAYDVLNHIFGGNLTKPTKQVPLTGQFVIIEQPVLMNPESINSTNSKKIDIFSYWANWLKNSTATHKPSFQLQPLKLPGLTETSSIDTSGFDKEGYVYYPTNCTQGKKCPIHVALHGCLQGKWRIGDVFAKKTGYLEVAELNNIIILFPQIIATQTDPSNKDGCWDWWGYGSPNYANKLGTQMAGVKKLIDSLRAINAALNA